uniref:Cation:proton antiporter n=1 Tax=candidate division WOR-3 bacterium TaxID=2052148 RepID=A0A7V4E5G7_UNCW3
MNIESLIFYGVPIYLIVMGILVILTTKNLFKMLLGLSIMDSGINILIVALGYIKGATAPIYSRYPEVFEKVVDPVPQALVLTAIVIGIAFLGLGLALVIRIKEKYGTVNVEKLKELKW